ncbi:hypothetical protein [Pseudomonas thivervalensis]|uniref:hypothetical protein n=1 Tax=Pseudomonas thivervalensis TaxID=86265 RepID=UPI003D980719
MKRIFLVAISLAVVGCARYQPIPTIAEHKPFHEYVTEAMIADNKSSHELRHVSTALATYSTLIVSSLRERASRAWGASNVTTAGGVGAVLGGLADQTGLLNTGLFTSGAGYILSSRAKFDQQVDVTLVTYRKLSCVGDQVGRLTPLVQRLVRTSGDQVAIDALASAPDDTVHYVGQIQDKHLISFYSMKPSVPTKEELIDYFARFTTVQASAAAAVAGRRSPLPPETEAAVKMMKSFAVELEECSKLI